MTCPYLSQQHHLEYASHVSHYTRLGMDPELAHQVGFILVAEDADPSRQRTLEEQQLLKEAFNQIRNQVAADPQLPDAVLQLLFKVIPNEYPGIRTIQMHELPLPVLCPMTQNPRPGSLVRIWYKPRRWHLNVVDLPVYIRKFIGAWRREGYATIIQGIEHMIQVMSFDFSKALEVNVIVKADVVVDEQRMVLFVKQEFSHEVNNTHNSHQVAQLR